MFVYRRSAIGRAIRCSTLGVRGSGAKKKGLLPLLDGSLLCLSASLAVFLFKGFHKIHQGLPRLPPESGCRWMPGIRLRIGGLSNRPNPIFSPLAIKRFSRSSLGSRKVTFHHGAAVGVGRAPVKRAVVKQAVQNICFLPIDNRHFFKSYPMVSSNHLSTS